MNELRQRIVDEALSWVRTPYHHLARLKGVGVDCALLLAEVYERAGATPHIDPGKYSPQWHLHQSAELYLRWLDEYGKRVDAPEPGDAVVFKVGRTYSHGAIVIKWPMAVHAYVGIGVMLEDFSKFYAERKRLYYTVPK